jgi:hypothetical protein
MAVMYRRHKKYSRDDEEGNCSSRIWTDAKDDFVLTNSIPEMWEEAVRMAGPTLDYLDDLGVSQLAELKSMQLKPVVQAGVLPEALHLQLVFHLWLLEVNIKSFQKRVKASKKL